MISDRGGTIAVIGMATVDYVYRVAHHPGADTEVRAEGVTRVAGGPAGRGAITAARLGGCRVRLLAMCGDDGAADALQEEIAGEGVDATWIAARQASQHSVVIAAGATRSIVWVAPSPADERALTALPGVLDGVRVALLDGTDERLTRAALEECRTRGITTVLDTGASRDWTTDILAEVDHVIAPQRYVARHFGEDSDRVVAEVASSRCRELFAVTRGVRGGAYAERGGAVGTWDADPIRAVDTTGAGDTFHGAYAWALAHGLDRDTRVRFAAWAAAAKASRSGNAGTPTAEAARRWLGDDDA